MKYLAPLIVLISLSSFAFGHTIDTNKSSDEVSTKLIQLFQSAENLNPDNSPMAIYSLTDESIPQEDLINFIQKEIIEKPTKSKKFFVIVETATLVWSRVELKKISQQINSDHIQMDAEYNQLVEMETQNHEDDSDYEHSKLIKEEEETNLVAVKTKAKNVPLSKFRIVIIK